jgi:hypothetical protein
MVECAILANTLIQILKAADRPIREHSEGALNVCGQLRFAAE